MEQLQQIKLWFNTLPSKEQMMVSITGILITITLLYLTIWEPLHLNLKDEVQQKRNQQETLAWMQQAADEVRTLRASGSTGKIRDKNKPAALVVEQAIKNAGLKTSVSKIESSGKNGARIILTDASFNQILVWLNTLATYNGIQVTSANFERSSKPGRTSARLTLERL